MQRPRIPIWVGGVWPHKAPMRRAARWDGAAPTGSGEGIINYLPPDEIREIATFIKERRSNDAPFDIISMGHTTADDPGHDAAAMQAYADAGATWWLEDISPWAFGWQWAGDWPIAQMNQRIRQGPPR